MNLNKFIIPKNKFLNKDTIGYYNQIYKNFNPDKPHFLNILKNTFREKKFYELEKARDMVVTILMDDIPKIIQERNISNYILVCVPRAKSLKSYSNYQLMFKKAIKIAANNLGVVDGTDYIQRVKNTRTTHIKKDSSFVNDGDSPYPGITIDTCEIESSKIINKNFILIDDIYTKTVNVDEDCIQALLDKGANEVIFYSIGYTSTRSQK